MTRKRGGSAESKKIDWALDLQFKALFENVNAELLLEDANFMKLAKRSVRQILAQACKAAGRTIQVDMSSASPAQGNKLAIDVIFPPPSSDGDREAIKKLAAEDTAYAILRELKLDVDAYLVDKAAPVTIGIAEIGNVANNYRQHRCSFCTMRVFGRWLVAQTLKGPISAVPKPIFAKVELKAILQDRHTVTPTETKSTVLHSLFRI